MTSVEEQKGFTIIEVILFLALSGLVFIIGFMGIGSRNRMVQYTDSIRSLDSFLQGQLNNVFIGVNNGVLTPSTGDRVLLGKYVYFCSAANSDPLCDGEGQRVLVWDVVGDRLSDTEIIEISNGNITCGSNGAADFDKQLLDCSSPVIEGDPESYDIDWGTTFLSANHGSNNYAVPGFGYLRSPNSSRIILIGHHEDSIGPEDPPGSIQAIDIIKNGSSDMFNSNKNGYDPRDPSLYFCFQGSTKRYAALSVGFRERQGAIEVFFDPLRQPPSVQTTITTDPSFPSTDIDTCGPV